MSLGSRDINELLKDKDKDKDKNKDKNNLSNFSSICKMI